MPRTLLRPGKQAQDQDSGVLAIHLFRKRARLNLDVRKLVNFFTRPERAIFAAVQMTSKFPAYRAVHFNTYRIIK